MQTLQSDSQPSVSAATDSFLKPAVQSTASPKTRREVPSSFAADVLRLASGTASAQLIGILAAPLIARMFAPQAFGALAIFASTAGIISVVSCLRYEIAIYLPERDEDAANIAALSSVLVTGMSAATAVLVWLFGSPALRLAKLPELVGWLWLLPLNVFITGMWTILNCWNQRKRRFLRITVLQVVTRVAMVGSQIGLGLAGFSSGLALIGTTVFGAFVTAAILAFQTLQDDRRLFVSSVSWRAIKQLWIRYSRFPRFGMAAALLNSASFQLPIILLSGFFSAAVVGSYSFGLRVLRVPGMLIGTNVNRAFFPRAAEARHRGTLGPSVESALSYLITLSFFPCFLLTLTGGSIFSLVFGSRWHEAGVYSQILSVWLFFWFISSPLNTVFAVLEEQALELRYQVANLSTRFLAMVVGGVMGNARIAIALFTLSGVAVYGSYCVSVLRKSGASKSAVSRILWSRMLLFLPAAALILVAQSFLPSPGVTVGLAIFVLVAYYWNLLRTDTVARGVLKGFFHRPTPASE